MMWKRYNSPLSTIFTNNFASHRLRRTGQRYWPVLSKFPAIFFCWTCCVMWTGQKSRPVRVNLRSLCRSFTDPNWPNYVQPKGTSLIFTAIKKMCSEEKKNCLSFSYRVSKVSFCFDPSSARGPGLNWLWFGYSKILPVTQSLLPKFHQPKHNQADGSSTFYIHPSKPNPRPQTSSKL